MSINSTTVDNFLAILKYEGPLNQTTAANLPVTVLDAVVSTYASSPKATIPSDLKTYTWSINVPDGGKIVDVDVALDITHPNDSDLMVWLVSPSGRRIQLINRVGGTGDNFKGTILDDEATVSIAQGPVPFTGRFRPAERLSDFDGETVQGLWKLEISDRVKSNRGTLNSWSLTITRGVGPAALMAAGAPAVASTSTLTAGRIEPLLAEALRRWEAAGVDTSALHGVDVRIADLGGNTLGLASGNTIWLDDNAAGWGWFVDPTPRSDSEFRAVGDQGEQNRIDLLSVLTHEIGHLLGHDHAEGGAMAETLAAGIRVIPEDHTQDNPQAQKGGATALTVPFTFTGGGLAPGWSQYTSDANRDLFLGTFTQTDDPVSYPVTLTYQTANGSADGSDYTAASGSLTFQPGKTRKTITITVKTDRLRESDETFFIDFTSLTPDVLGGVRGRGTILNDD